MLDPSTEEQFEQWFNQLEGYHLLSERFYNELEDPDPKYVLARALLWVKAAFAAGAESIQYNRTEEQ